LPTVIRVMDENDLPKFVWIKVSFTTDSQIFPRIGMACIKLSFMEISMKLCFSVLKGVVMVVVVFALESVISDVFHPV